MRAGSISAHTSAARLSEEAIGLGSRPIWIKRAASISAFEAGFGAGEKPARRFGGAQVRREHHEEHRRRRHHRVNRVDEKVLMETADRASDQHQHNAGVSGAGDQRTPIRQREDHDQAGDRDQRLLNLDREIPSATASRWSASIRRSGRESRHPAPARAGPAPGPRQYQAW